MFLSESEAVVAVEALTLDKYSVNVAHGYLNSHMLAFGFLDCGLRMRWYANCVCQQKLSDGIVLRGVLRLPGSCCRPTWGALLQAETKVTLACFVTIISDNHEPAREQTQPTKATGQPTSQPTNVRQARLHKFQHEILERLRRGCRLNPRCMSCWGDEGFVGHSSNISRKCPSVTSAASTLVRYQAMLSVRLPQLRE